MIAALVPVKALDGAKGRLGEVLSNDERRSLTLAMLDDVLAALRAVRAIERSAVVSPDPDVLGLASDRGAGAIQEPPGCRGVNQALSHGASTLDRDDATALVVIVADLPTVLPGDVEAALAELPERGVVLVPTEDRGTGLLALRPPGVIPLRFGYHSSVLHKREAAARGLHTRVLHLGSLSRDIDGPADLAALLDLPAETATQRLLAELGLAERLAARTA